MFKDKETGCYEDDFRRLDVVPRLHVSYGTKKKDEAATLHATMLGLFRSKDRATLEAIRSGAMSVQQVRRLLDEGKPLSNAPALGAWPSVRDGVTQYLAWLATNPRKTEGTHTAAEVQTNRFVAWLGADADLPLDAISTKRVTEYQAYLLASGNAINTVTAYVWRVGTVFRWHRDTEFRDAQEAKRVPRLLHVPIDPDAISTTRTRRDRYLTELEAERLLAACPPQLLCPVALGLFAGLRIDEMLHLRPGFDVDVALGLLTVQVQPGWRPKNGKRRHVPIAPPLRPLLEHHLSAYASEEWLTPSIRDGARCFNRDTFGMHFETIVRNAELVTGRKDPKGVVFHTLRHTFASWLIMRGVDLYTTAQLLGNSLKMIEGTYGHLAPDYKSAAVERLAGAVAIPEVPQASGHVPAPSSEPPETETFATPNATSETDPCHV